MAKLQLQGSEVGGKSPETDRDGASQKKISPLEHVTPSSPVFHVSEEIRVNHQVFVHREIFIESLPGPLPKDRNGETQDKLLYFITAAKHQP